VGVETLERTTGIVHGFLYKDWHPFTESHPCFVNIRNVMDSLFKVPIPILKKSRRIPVKFQ
jgi:hypothetical protein